jgi:hypothetical protein
MADVSTWSTTAGSNNSAAPDGWAENQLPSTVNNCAREMMAQVATWRQKFGGWMMENVGLTATVGSGNLTVTLRVKDGSTSPSSTNKVGIGFRSSTLTTGGFSYVEATSGIDVTLPSGGTLGFANSATGYVYVYAINNAGTMELAIAGQSVFDEGILHTTTAIGTGSDSSNVLYSTSARTDVAIRLIGRITIQHGSGTWSNSPTVIALWSPEIDVTGTVIYDADITLGGHFGTDTARLIVIKTTNGKLATMHRGSTMTHSATTQPQSSDGVIPAAYRPTQSSSVTYELGASRVKLVQISSSGRVNFFYFDWAGSGSSATSTGEGWSVSWYVSD